MLCITRRHIQSSLLHNQFPARGLPAKRLGPGAGARPNPSPRGSLRNRVCAPSCEPLRAKQECCIELQACAGAGPCGETLPQPANSPGEGAWPSTKLACRGGGKVAGRHTQRWLPMPACSISLAGCSLVYFGARLRHRDGHQAKLCGEGCGNLRSSMGFPMIKNKSVVATGACVHPSSPGRGAHLASEAASVHACASNRAGK